MAVVAPKMRRRVERFKIFSDQWWVRMYDGANPESNDNRSTTWHLMKLRSNLNGIQSLYSQTQLWIKDGAQRVPAYYTIRSFIARKIASFTIGYQRRDVVVFAKQSYSNMGPAAPNGVEREVKLKEFGYL